LKTLAAVGKSLRERLNAYGCPGRKKQYPGKQKFPE
jgi:hypothetical protein